MSTNAFPEARKSLEQGLDNTMYSFSQQDISAVGAIWKGTHSDGVPDLVVTNDPIPTLATSRIWMPSRNWPRLRPSTRSR